MSYFSKIPKNNDLLKTAKCLRRTMTRQEKHIWFDFLQKHPAKIYKQRIVGNYIVDFYCATAKLVIEIDGSQHRTGKGLEYDQTRDAYMESLGLETLRISDFDIDHYFYDVCEQINLIIMKRNKSIFEKRSSMKYCTPEAVGISSADVLKFYQKLDERCLSTHDVIIARGNNIFTEAYYAPFHKNFLHRMYSVSKSFVSIAVGFCEQDGLLSLDDPFSKYFSEYITPGISDKVTDMTIREMLLMETGRAINTNWFETVEDDRCKTYLEISQYKYPNTLFDYDSTGSFMLGAIVEKVTGKPFLEYLKDKVLRDIGFSEASHVLKAPGGHSWGDSAVMCTAEDLLLFARFVLNGGTWNGKRYLNERYIKEATDTRICNNPYGFENPSGYGYGYQFWGLAHGCYAMFGMGIQLAVCDPTHDLVFIINSDNQGNDLRYAPILYAFYDHIFDRISDKPLMDDPTAYKALNDYTATRKLFALRGPTENDFSAKLAGKTYRAEENPMGIQWFRFEFEENEGVFHYENAQGVKALRLGFGHNVFQKFPQAGYSDAVGAKEAPGHLYDCAVSADWPEAQKLRVRVQIIDKYFGNLAMLFGFRDENHVSVRMEKCAEDFLQEYTGWMNAKAE